MSKQAEQKALIRFPEQMTPLVYQDVINAFGGKTEVDFNLLPRSYFQLGYEQAEKDTIAEVEKWLKANLHHLSCWNADEFCISLRNYLGIEK